MVINIIILSIILSLFGYIIFCAKKREENDSKRKLKLFGIAVCSFMIASALSIVFFFWVFGEFRDSNPVIEDTFYLHETGAKREYIITPRFKDWLAGANGDYELTVGLNKIPPSAPESIEFHPIVKVSTLLNSVLLDSITIDAPLEVTIDERYEKKVLLTKLSQVIWKVKNQNYTIKVEVLKGDKSLAPYIDNFITKIAVDSYP